MGETVQGTNQPSSADAKARNALYSLTHDDHDDPQHLRC